ncbi:hypothetical protein MRX96_018808 [Rhipicephalus microplus]
MRLTPCNLFSLESGSEHKTVNSRVTVFGPAQHPRSYMAETLIDVLQCNRKHLVPSTGSPDGHKTSSPAITITAQTEITTSTRPSNEPRRLEAVQGAKDQPLRSTSATGEPKVLLQRHAPRGWAGESPGRKDHTCEQSFSF